METITLDLYETYKERFGRNESQRKLNQLAVSEGRDESEIFYGLFRILMACDAAHDFCGNRGFKEYAKDDFINQLIDELKENLGKYNLVKVCEKLISKSFAGFKIDDDYFSTDAKAKSISGKILNLFGLTTVPLKNIGQGDCAGDNSITRMVKILNKSYYNNSPVELRIDATSNSSALIPIYSSILEQSRRKASRCESYNDLIFVTDISSEYDAASKDKLQKTIIEADKTFKKGTINKIEDTEYNIYCTIKGNPVNIVNCQLTSNNSEDNRVVTLNIVSYFNKSNLYVNNVSNDSNNNSVEGIVPKAQATGYYYHYSVFKTMGDFLQIVSFLHSKTYENKMYVSFDILSSEICSLFSKFSFLEAKENKGRTDLIADGLYVYLTDDEKKIQEGAGTLMSLYRGVGNIKDTLLKRYTEGASREEVDARMAVIEAKKRAKEAEEWAKEAEEWAQQGGRPPGAQFRPRRSWPRRSPQSQPSNTSFGKKPKVSIRNTSTRVLKAKLKSVGVPVTKVIRGKRMKLTRKELEMRAGAFKRLQIRCQKEGISLTYVSKNGRKYKSAKRLLSDLKRQPKPKPKPKPKMNWG